ncbi:class I SAM-dependent methyltransferase [Afifella pfennigii]|uniref:class I SAM-dependent methyltransferase n=1 Tax=Afifella pfennigii TaxID=209897 RepID=UPI00047CD713|nr:methyltransferase domain-containing protein [Afifella pfennigii]
MAQNATPLGERIEDEFRFFKTWAKRPMKMGAVVPSSRAFARMMIRHGKPDPEGWTLELGPGTGVITEELIRAGIPQERLVCVEYEQHFYDLLKKRFPRVNLIRGDAFNLGETLGAFADTQFSAVLSGVPVLLISEEKRRHFIADCLSRVRPGGNMTQLSYSFTTPQKPVPGSFRVRSSPWVGFNLPPGRVWIFERETA